MRLRTACTGAFIAGLASHSSPAVDDLHSALQNLSPHLLDVKYSVLLVLDPSCQEATSGFKIIQRRSKKRGINSDHLRSLGYVPLSHRTDAPVDLSVKMALLNIRSITNKTFLINDLISLQGLDFLFMTETWLKEGDRDFLIEASPLDFLSLNSPRTGGRGGGVATIFRSCFKCKPASEVMFGSLGRWSLHFYTDLLNITKTSSGNFLNSYLL